MKSREFSNEQLVTLRAMYKCEDDFEAAKRFVIDSYKGSALYAFSIQLHRRTAFSLEVVYEERKQFLR